MVENQVIEQQIIILDTSRLNQDPELSNKENRKKIHEFLVRQYSGKSVVNAETGMLIEFSRKGFEKLLYKFGTNRVHCIGHLIEILQAAKFQTTEPDNRDRADILAAHKFGCWVKIDSEILEAWLVVRQTRQGFFFYNCAIGQ